MKNRQVAPAEKDLSQERQRSARGLDLRLSVLASFC
jgi:hypothetical protein